MVWYDPKEKLPPIGQKVVIVYEDKLQRPENDDAMIKFAYIIYRDTDNFVIWMNDTDVPICQSQKVLAWTAWSPEYLFEPVDVHAPIRGIVKETNREKGRW